MEGEKRWRERNDGGMEWSDAGASRTCAGPVLFQLRPFMQKGVAWRDFVEQPPRRQILVRRRYLSRAGRRRSMRRRLTQLVDPTGLLGASALMLVRMSVRARRPAFFLR